MSKIIVETTGNHMLLDVSLRPPQEVPYNRPAVVVRTHLMNQRIGNKTLKVLAEDLPDSAQDEDFADALVQSKGDVELAVDAYLAEVMPKEEPKEEPKSKAAAKKGDK